MGLMEIHRDLSKKLVELVIEIDKIKADVEELKEKKADKKVKKEKKEDK